MLLFFKQIIVSQCISIKKYILFLGVGPTQELDDTTITEEAKYSTNF